jgi:hypothetical protein
MSSSKQGNVTTTQASSKSYAQYSETRSSSDRKTSSANKSIKEGAKKGSTSPKLPSYRGMADKCRFEGETVRHFNAGKLAVFELKAPNHRRDEIQVNIISKYYFGNSLWKLALGTRFGNSLWELALETRFGNSLWELALGTRFGNLLWKLALGTRFVYSLQVYIISKF